MTNLDTLALGQTYPRLLAPDDEDVALPRCEGVVDGVLDMHNVEASIMTFPMRDDAHTAHVASTCSHGDDAGIEADEVGDLTGSEIDLDGIIDLDGRIRIADSTASPTHTTRQSIIIQSPLSIFHQVADRPKHDPTTE